MNNMNANYIITLVKDNDTLGAISAFQELNDKVEINKCLRLLNDLIDEVSLEYSDLAADINVTYKNGSSNVRIGKENITNALIISETNKTYRLYTRLLYILEFIQC